jgi:DNA-binding CsgD family transcriptional regulator
VAAYDPYMAVAVPDQRGFVRLLHRGFDLPAYLEAADSALARLVPFEASCWLSLDPATMLPTSHFSREYGFDQLLQLAANEYLDEDINRFADLARAELPVAILSVATDGHNERSRRHVEFLAPYGFGEGDELRAIFRDGDAAWGAVAIHRRHGAFTTHEAGVVAQIGALAANGIRRAILAGAMATDRGSESPGVILLDTADAVDSVSPAARRWLAELVDSTVATHDVPLVVASIAHQARRAGRGRSDELATVRVPRRSGGWLRLDASLLEDGRRVAVVISPAHEPEVADLIAQAYRLTPREWEVTRLTMRGLSTQEMAAALRVTPYTVQDHLKSVFDKVGVRSRRELVAQLFLQQCAPRLAAGTPPAIGGWFPRVDA